MLSDGLARICKQQSQITILRADIVHGLLYSIPIAMALVVAAALVGWRIWGLTLRPCLRPKEIAELPYWIPCR